MEPLHMWEGKSRCMEINNNGAKELKSEQKELKTWLTTTVISRQPCDRLSSLASTLTRELQSEKQF
ncbi:hypothetical protein P3S68_027040 [Capsicum galapagoense]